MEWVEKLVSEMPSRLSDVSSGNQGLVRLTALAMAIDSKRFKKDAVIELKNAFKTELNQYIAAGNAPSIARKHKEEILHHHRRIEELALLTTMQLDAESRRQVAGAISDERVALGDSYYAYIEHIPDRLE